MSEVAQCEYVMPEGHHQRYLRGKRCDHRTFNGGRFCWHHGQECARCGVRCSPRSGELCAHCLSGPRGSSPSSAVPLESMIEEMTRGDRSVWFAIDFHPTRPGGHEYLAWTRYMGESETLEGDGPDPRSAIEALYAVWRERE